MDFGSESSDDEFSSVPEKGKGHLRGNRVTPMETEAVMMRLFSSTKLPKNGYL
jgi:hypothetical protein